MLARGWTLAAVARELEEADGFEVIKMSIWVTDTFLTPVPPWHIQSSLWQHPGSWQAWGLETKPALLSVHLRETQLPP
jgi:hypothetical protein